MRYRPPSVVIVKRLAALLLMALAGGTVLSASSARADCRPLAAEAEQAFGIPPGILQAVALAESGVAGTAWPWTINASGRPFYLDSYAEALAVAEAARKRYGHARCRGMYASLLAVSWLAFPRPAADA